MSSAHRRCAIYTRKSHTEGLDQPFNSLDAQREAGVDYIKSQKHEHWQVIDKHYDDGGFTGGNMDRPGLYELLQDIEHGVIDIVVVYKVDRLSRSLHDFAQIIKKFNDYEVAFVSVTQQFNTATSMGRLTLNMLLSFAQFEREVTGERIRDKIAATKKKGLWVTGHPPLGYEIVDRQLVIIPAEADLVNRIYMGYLEHTSLLELTNQLNQAGHVTKRWLSSRDRWHGGRKLTPKYVYRILTNPLYIGKITHNSSVWPGQHKSIVRQALWDRVQETMDRHQRQTRHRWNHPYLLKGKLRTHENSAMSPSTVHRPTKNKDQKRLVGYYVSQTAMRRGYAHCPVKTINAKYIDDLVRTLVLDHLDSHSLEHLRTRDCEGRDFWLREMIKQVVLSPDQLAVTLNTGQIEACREYNWPEVDTETNQASSLTCLYKPTLEHRRDQIVLTLAIEIKRLDGKRLLLSSDGQDLLMPTEPQPKEHIVTAIGSAYRWREQLIRDGLTVSQLANRLGVSGSNIRKYLPLVYLSSDILKRALTGQLSASVTMKNLLAAARYLDWRHQAHLLGLKQAVSNHPSHPKPH